MLMTTFLMFLCSTIQGNDHNVGYFLLLKTNSWIQHEVILAINQPELLTLPLCSWLLLGCLLFLM